MNLLPSLPPCCTLSPSLADQNHACVLHPQKKTGDALTEKNHRHRGESHTLAFRAGHKLGDVIARAESIRAAFYHERMFGLIGPNPACEEDPRPFLNKLKAAKVQLAAIKAAQKSRILVILAMLSWTSWAYLFVNIGMRAVAVSIATYTKLYTSQILGDAVEDDWEALVAASLTALVVLHFAENWVVGLTQNALRSQTPARVRHQAADRIVQFDSPPGHRLLRRDRRACDQAAHINGLGPSAIFAVLGANPDVGRRF